ncbi:Low affinity vacuolar monovalent cation/H antiporter [Golovinomyces cichoracearum]|uniref:Low affinity vacuolar monovalent cation/H antiporter n=1 Tax=Golovinomyces cichoracearum TaxID=62708 RepID=A0A420JAN9_9PEZI|nr:Low affinity vacuolar monovalent cation/H antiporter [Golovinomyces cichoracearum]
MSSSTSDEIHDIIDHSNPVSPTDNRPSLVRWETTATQDQPQDVILGSFQSSETVRRCPETVSYGSIPTQPQKSSKSKQTSSEASKSNQQTGAVNIDTGRLKSQNSAFYASASRGRVGQKSKKTGPGRRTTSNARAPHRGQEFSVDDDVSEIGDYLIKSNRRSSTTLRRRPTVHQGSTLARIDSSNTEIAETDDLNKASSTAAELRPDTIHHESVDDDDDDDDEDCDFAEGKTSKSDVLENEDDESLSDTESFTLKDRQQAINETHPFGIRIWKPALYKKSRSVQKDAEGDIHSSPGGLVSRWLLFFNILWTVWFGWWLALVAFSGAMVCFIFGAAPSARRYGRVLWGLSIYLFYPFGRFVRLEQDEAYAHEDQGEGRSITEYEQWQNGDLEDGRLFFGPQGSRSIIGRSRQSINSTSSENDCLLSRGSRSSKIKESDPPSKRRLFGRGQWNTGRVIFFLFFYGLITPLLIFVSGICWLLVFWIPMGKVTLLLFYHLRRHPLALTFQPDSAYSRGTIPNSSILVCSYRAVGLKYWKYTIDGTNIFLINLMGIVLFVIFDYFILGEVLGLKGIIITDPAFLFVAALLSVIPLAYFIGQAVASISAQSSMGLGAAINALFSTLVEVYLYCVALNQGKGRLVEGSIIGSIFAGVLFLPGISMCFGAIKRKTQRFNIKSASATSTMLLFAVIAAFGPTLFYQIFGTHELNCVDCFETKSSTFNRECRRCNYSQTPSFNDRFFIEVVRPYCWIAAALLFLSYIIGLWFTLRTHAAVIWNEADEKKVQDGLHNTGHHLGSTGHLRQSRSGSENRVKEAAEAHLNERILGKTTNNFNLDAREEKSRKKSSHDFKISKISLQTAHQPPPKSQNLENSKTEIQDRASFQARNTCLERDVAELATTTPSALSLAIGDLGDAPNIGQANMSRKPSNSPHNRPAQIKAPRTGVFHDTEEVLHNEAHAGSGHDAPNWSRKKSSIVLCVATILYALISEVLVNTVDVVLKNVSISEKFLGITLFALVPNTTEFLNAISFAMNGNIALSMEIGSAYVLQVCLLQIPALVLYSAVYGQYVTGSNSMDYTFNLIFPQWDMITVTLCVFLLNYVYGEGKSNYFKGSILLLSYLVVIVGFWLSGITQLDSVANRRFDIIDAQGLIKEF